MAFSTLIRYLLSLGLFIATLAFTAFNKQTNAYTVHYHQGIQALEISLKKLSDRIQKSDFSTQSSKDSVYLALYESRLAVKKMDIWFRYFEPIAYKKLNGPLPVEWETEVFEKFEKPYRREGAGLTLLEGYLEEENFQKDSALRLLALAEKGLATYSADSITSQLASPDHFFFANRLFLLNLSAIYTTGFECPNPQKVIPELGALLKENAQLYPIFQASFPEYPLPAAYHKLYAEMQDFVAKQAQTPEAFDHYHFIKDYVNPLFILNQKLLKQYKLRSINNNDYTLSREEVSIFDKKLYKGQYSKGVFTAVEDEKVLEEIAAIGKQLFFDPILSGNNQRSCASCHHPNQTWADTTVRTALHFDKQKNLARNTPSLVNVVQNHLIMWDGKFISLQDQAKGVITNPDEMNLAYKDIVEKVLSCEDYKKSFKKFLKYTPYEKEISTEHIVSALTLYYGKLSFYESEFDLAMRGEGTLSEDAILGFNLSMGKAQCATCHFPPTFAGIKPPYIGNEFEVIGSPEDADITKLSPDVGRYKINPAPETFHAFRTPTLRNVGRTAPYMHNGVFPTLLDLLSFYNLGGGAGHGLLVENQTLSTDTLFLPFWQREAIISFIQSLNENVPQETLPTSVPKSKNEAWNQRKVGGEY